MNEAFGIPIWQNDNLWEDSDTQTADRLNWPEESRTSEDSSYRKYANSKTRVLGARPFSLSLYATKDKPSLISMVFANKGDVAELVNPGVDQSTAGGKRQADLSTKDYKKFVHQDVDTIQKKLTELLGAPQQDRFGQGRDTRETVKRWDWKGHSILLSMPVREEYVAVRIVPTELLKAGATTRITAADLHAKLLTRIERRENGDVILKDIPMVDQGPKGYCVPATWERALRYMGIPADMYVLAMAARTEVGGGTHVSDIVWAVNELVGANGRFLAQEGGRVQIQSIARNINKGMPVMWALCVDEGLNHRITDRTKQRANTTDWDGYKKSLQPFRNSARQIRINKENGHVCMIIGYNEKTREIAISDSWGKSFAERWITPEEADAVSQGHFIVIN
ncbi:MAG: C39 family peptidase [Chthoniobacterales bacterium]